MSSLITGASGFVAGHLVSYLTSLGEEVIKTSLEREKKDNTYVALDIENFDNCVEVLEKTSPSVIYHLAGIAAPMVCEKDFSLALKVNVGGVYNILKASEVTSKKIKVVIISSSECYGKVDQSLMPIKENVECNPANNYGLSKLMAEQITKKFMYYSKNSNLECAIARPFNHIGPGQRMGFVVPDFCMQIVKIMRGEQEPVIFVGNLESKRDFSDVRDIVRGYHLLATQKGQGIYNFCSGTPRKIRDILDSLIEISGTKIDVIKDLSKIRSSDIPLFDGDNSRAKCDLGWEPMIPFRKSLEDVFNYFCCK